jgi:hypothetical protein
MNKSIAGIVLCSFVLCSPHLANATDAWIDCKAKYFHSRDTEDDGNPNTFKKEKNFLNKGDWMKWEIEAPKGTVVVIEPMQKKNYDGTQTLGMTPFELAPPYQFTITASNGQKEKLRLNPNLTNGTYGYKITCTYEDGTFSVIDPMIEVPRPPLVPPDVPSPQTQTQTKD